MSYYDKNGEILKVGDKVYVDLFGDIHTGEIVKFQMSLTGLAHGVVVKSDNWSSCVPLGVVTKIKPKPHPHAELIKMWADDPSIEIQYFCDIRDKWVNTGNPGWDIDLKYRIKPKEKKFVSKYKFSWLNSNGTICNSEEFQTQEDANEFFKQFDITNWTCLEWTKKEFEVED